MTMEKLELGKYGLPSEQPFDPAALDKMKMESFNQTAGSETGYDCPKCLNRGKIAFLRPGGGAEGAAGPVHHRESGLPSDEGGPGAFGDCPGRGEDQAPEAPSAADSRRCDRDR